MESLQAMNMWSTRGVTKCHPHINVPNAGVKNASADMDILRTKSRMSDGRKSELMGPTRPAGALRGLLIYAASMRIMESRELMPLNERGFLDAHFLGGIVHSNLFDHLQTTHFVISW